MEKITNKDNREIEWHKGFVSAMKLELKEYAKKMIFNQEYVLNNVPKFIDLVIIKCENNCKTNNFMLQLKKLNIFEYKGVGAELNMDVFAKGLAYACLFKSEQNEIEPRDFGDISLTFVRAAKPVKLLKSLKCKRIVVKHEKGVYNIYVIGLFEVNIIVLSEIDFAEYPWLASLTKKMDVKKARELVRLEKKAYTKWERDNAENVMDVTIKANKKVFQIAKGGNDYMCEAMWELMQPEIDAKFNELLAEKNDVISSLDAKLLSKKEELENINKELANKDEELANKDEELANKDEELANKDEELANKDEELANKDAMISSMQAELAELKRQLGMAV